MNSNQYLRPEDLPITDAKKSPLALLAQTCSNIGADLLGAGKLMSSSSEKRSKSSSYRLDVSSVNDANTNSRPESASSDKTHTKSVDTNHRSSVSSDSAVNEVDAPTRIPTTTSTSSKISFKPYDLAPMTANNKCHRNSADNTHSDYSTNGQSGSGRRSATSDVMHNSKSISPKSNNAHHGSNNRASPGQKSASHLSHSSTEAGKQTPSNLLQSSTHDTNGLSSKDSSEAKPAVSLNGYTHGTHYPSLASVAEHDMLKSAAQYSAAAAAAYMSQQHHHAMLAAGAGKPPPCPDPYCRGCQLSLAGVPTATPCCNTLPGAAAAAAHAAAMHSQYGLPPLGRYPPGVMSGGRPFVCSWVGVGAGGTYCVKTFSTSEELLQHLKSHTSNFNPGLSSLGQYPHLDPMLTSPVAGLRRTAFDPVNRFHPYKNFGGMPMNPLQSVLQHHGGSIASMNPHAMSSLGLSYPHNAAAAYGPYAGRIGPPIPP